MSTTYPRLLDRSVTLGAIAAVLAASVAACGGSPKPEVPAAPTATAPTPPAPSGATTTITAAAPPAATTATEPTPPAPTGPTAAFHLTGLATPESVLYDDANDRYLVSNINGKATDADNNGYISVVSSDGKMTTEKWIAGGQNKVTLNAPKGSAIVNGVLYVADLDTVRMFDLKSGAPKGDIKVPGATFLNDMAAGRDGKLYVSDSGLKAGASGFDPTGTDAVYVIEKGKVKALAKDKELGKPNGLLVGANGVWVVTFGSGELYRLDDKGKKQDVQKLPKGSLDGIVMVGDTLYISSWEASAVYKGKIGGTFDVAIPNVKSPADIGFDTKRSRLLVPLFMENVVEGYDVK